MTGAELLEQVLDELLASPTIAEWHERARANAEDCIICNLDGCVLLTSEEAEKMRRRVRFYVPEIEGRDAMLALLEAK